MFPWHCPAVVHLLHVHRVQYVVCDCCLKRPTHIVCVEACTIVMGAGGLSVRQNSALHYACCGCRFATHQLLPSSCFSPRRLRPVQLRKEQLKGCLLVTPRWLCLLGAYVHCIVAPDVLVFRALNACALPWVC